MGGIVGLHLAVNSPELFKSLVLICTSADAETAVKRCLYRLLSVVARCFGLQVLANSVMRIMFGETFLRDERRSELRETWRRHFLANNPTGGIRAVLGVSGRAGVTDKIDRIVLPVLVIAGAEDNAISPERAQRIHDRIAGSKLVVIPRAGHTAPVEEPAAINAAISEFYSNIRGLMP